MATEDPRNLCPAPIGDEDCTECGARLREHEDFWLGIAKSVVVGVGGLITSGSVGEIIHIHVWSVMHGQPGLGIDLGWVLTGLFGFLGAIIYWAFPKRSKK